MKLRYTLLALAALAIATGPAPAVAADKGVVSITYDDCPETQWRLGLPVAKKHDLVGTVFVSTGYVGADPWCMTWENVADFKEAGWEIASHAVHHIEMYKLNDWVSEIVGSATDLMKKVGVAPVGFAPPYGEATDDHINFIREIGIYRYVVLESGDGFNALTGYDRYNLDRLAVTSAKEACALVQKAADEDAWAILLFHGIRPAKESPPDYELHLEIHNEVLACVAKARDEGLIEVKTISQVVAKECDCE
ncbi:hypothetical protein C4568_00700 [Candidatus Parcubacteria bacterium]|nr:MAG: hypothetical protein C4568_00700 [Candidatus Parcubacteria bacterium]